jgi:hypothetical protein
MNTPSTTDNLPNPPAPQALVSVPVPALESTAPLAVTTAGPTIPGVLGTVEVLPELEQAEYQACEAALLMGWGAFIQVGLALTQIRDARLDRVKFHRSGLLGKPFQGTFPTISSINVGPSVTRAGDIERTPQLNSIGRICGVCSPPSIP